jgi:hypothetical protein
MHFKKHEYVRFRMGYHCYEFVGINTFHHYFMYRAVHEEWTMYIYVLEIVSEIRVFTESLDKYLTRSFTEHKEVVLEVTTRTIVVREQHLTTRQLR